MPQADFEITVDEAGHIVTLSGWFDATQVGTANPIFDKIKESTVVDFKDLKYISSAGLGVLLGAQKRLMDDQKGLKLINLNEFVGNVFHLAGFDLVFEIE